MKLEINYRKKNVKRTNTYKQATKKPMDQKNLKNNRYMYMYN